MHRVPRRLIVTIALLLAAGAAAMVYGVILADLPDPERWLGNSATAFPGANTPSTLIMDRRGRLLYEVIDPQGSKQIAVPLSAVPLACQQATIATEDSHFYKHPGVDPLAIVRAFSQNLRQGTTVSGGSTLTQQLARNLFFSTAERNERSLRRKLREAWLAWRIERRHSKEELLALYLNTTYYGHYAVGIEAAAQAYFGMGARDLDLAQCALLAGLPQYPAGYNPLENLEAARTRQAVVLNLMAKEGYITEQAAGDAQRERLAFAGTPFPIEAPHFVMWVQSQLETSLPAEQWRAGGLRVTTTLDLDWQRQAESTVARRVAQLRPCAAGAGLDSCDRQANPNRRVDNAALIALDPHTGAVRTMVGSPDYFDPAISGAVNAALSLRQPGSAIKPLTYAAALNPAVAHAGGEGPWTAATLISDVRTVFPTQEGYPYVPQNYDLAFHGPVTLREALANSYNVPAVKTLQYASLDALISQALRLGIEWTDECAGCASSEESAGDPATSRGPARRFGLALTLGGGEVRLLDLTAAYAAFANGGYRVEPYGILSVQTSAGQVIWEAGQATDKAAGSELLPESVLDARVAYLITDILSDEQARLPAFGPGNVLEIGRPAAAKTGTTTDWRDNWTVGYTPEFVTGVWVGNADNSPMLDISGISGAGPIWHDFMVTVHRGLPATFFERPPGLIQVEICADSGQLPGGTGDWTRTPAQLPVAHAVPCPARRQELFIQGTEPRQVDRNHIAVPIDTRSGQPAEALTPQGSIVTEVFWNLPDEYAPWARDTGFPQPPLLATRQSTADGFATGQRPTRSELSMASPDPNRAYRLDPGLPVSAQRLPVRAIASTDLAGQGSSITILLDGAALANVEGPDFTYWWQLAIGEHTFQAQATKTDGSRVTSEPVTIVVNR